MPFKTSVKSFRNHQHLFRDRPPKGNPLSRRLLLVDTRGPLALWCCAKIRLKSQIPAWVGGQTMAAKFFSCDGQAIRRFLVCLFWGLLAVCPFIPVLYAQGVGAAIQGTVRDSTSAIIPGATITAIRTETNLRRTATSNEAG